MAVLALFISFHATAQVTDTLTAVTLVSKKPMDITTAVTPVQQLNKTSLSQLNSLSVADAVKYFSGVVVKDYGGIGGLKTVSVRSLGANHTGVMYDGLMLQDAQGGQIDLGRLSLDNIAMIQLFNNQPTDILLPARSYASASVIAISSMLEQENETYRTEASATCRMGSFGFINPAARIKYKPGKKISLAASGEYHYAKGDYAFTDYETGATKQKRINADIRSYRMELDTRYQWSDSNTIKFKAYYYDSRRGLPGAVILYHPYANERLNNRNLFTQAAWKKNLSSRSRIMIAAKFTSDYKYYIDPSYANNAGKLENEFKQQEWYVTAGYTIAMRKGISAAYAADYFNNTLKRTDSFAVNFANPVRNTLLNNLSVQWKRRLYSIQANLLYTYIKEKTSFGNTASDLQKLTPAVSGSVQPFRKLPLYIRASFKNIFRAPTFDDLYFTNIGNTALRPEYAKQYNIGLTIHRQFNTVIQSLIVTTDGYYNRVTDKILAVPRQNLFQWSMMNVGTVEIRGLDAAVHIIFFKWKNIDVSLNGNYSYQYAVDLSNAFSSTYKKQLPYTPKHSGAVNLNISFRNFSCNYNLTSSSYRYRLGEQIPDNYLSGWSTLDMTISYRFATGRQTITRFFFEANNMGNKQYEIIKYYPMPRFNYRAGLTVNFKK